MALVTMEVSEERKASIIRAERISLIETRLAVTGN
jgi:hypothetical protein